MPKIRARYKVVGPKMVTRTVTKATIDKETKSMNTSQVEITEKMWMVFFPQGHSTRMNEKELRFHNLHIKPRLVDMETGDILETGGDPYDLSEDIADRDIVLLDELELPSNVADNSASKRKQTEKVE